jgi:FdhD protein
LNSQTRETVRWKEGAQPTHAPDALATEEPLEIQIDTHPISITMRTPGHDEELAAGFLLSEGLISDRGQIARIAPHPRNPAGNAINLFLTPDVTVDFARLTRHVFASSSCGLCGAATIEAVHKAFPPIESTAPPISAKLLVGLPGKLRSQQEGFERTGGLHAAGLFTSEGELLIVREDVGRHNAVDKVLGHALLQGLLPLDKQILVVSGRASFEIMQKALAGRLPMVLAVSAPSSLAVDFAQTSGQTLVAFARDDRLNVYSHPERVRFE